MTYVVSNNLITSLESNSTLNFYYVEIITFFAEQCAKGYNDGESHTEEVEAASPEEEQATFNSPTEWKAIAASMYDEVDSTMVQGCVAC